MYIYIYIIYGASVTYGAQVVKNLPANAGDTGDMGLIPGLGRSPGKGNSYPLQYSCLENSMGSQRVRKIACIYNIHMFINTTYVCIIFINTV